jgi:hypothetical protein
MPCLFGLFALLVPRLLILVLWFLTTWFVGVFDTLLWPILGFLFAPTALLWYSVVINLYGGTWDTLQIAVMVIALLIDFSPGTSRRRR